MHEYRKKLDYTRVRRKRNGSVVKMKHTYRVKAHDAKERLLFFKTRTKAKLPTIRRMATFRGFIPDRITK